VRNKNVLESILIYLGCSPLKLVSRSTFQSRCYIQLWFLISENFYFKM